MRLFIAIRLNREMKDALCAAQSDMYARGVRGSFTPEENLHLTLAFIGEYAEPEIALEALSSLRFDPFCLALDGCGCFGDLWWAGIRECPELAQIVRRVRRALAENGIPFDRKRFSAHITLVRRTIKAQLVEINPAGMVVNHISLMRSDRGKRGMLYTEIGRINAQNDR